jgi:NADH dehydrogenase [ubiquinone] 1 alpha subcomplex assembly factor 7
MSLDEKIKRQIQISGPIGIAEYMMQCLYDNDFGYYTTQKPIGKDGDFITAPEITQVFGEMIGLWVYSCFQNLGQPAKFRLLELGAGRGTLLKDITRTIDKLGLVGKYEICIAETNENLRALQKSALENKEIKYLSDFAQISDLSAQLPIIIIGNEFIDCMPIRQFVKTPQGWRERLIGLDDDRLCFGLGKELPQSPDFLLEGDKMGSVREFCPPLEGFISQIAQILKKQNGFGLFIDYGHFGNQEGDTFQALYRHKKTSPLENLGQCDLTAHVDFGAIEKYAINEKLNIEGPATQAQFLYALGIDHRQEQLIAQNPSQEEKIVGEIKRLIDPEQMGDLFKVIVLSALDNN